MPSKRILAAIVVKDGWAVQSFGFTRYLPVGRPEVAARFFSSWGADEILLFDIDASAQGRTVDPELIARVAEGVHVPLTVGGGIATVDDVRRVVRSGADKVSINLGALNAPDQVREAAGAFGNQCIVGAMDVRRTADGAAAVVAEGGRVPTGQGLADYARRLAGMDVGEILVHSVDRDGTRGGFDVETVQEVAAAVGVPAIALGGAGHPAHFRDVLRLDEVSAAGAGNLFHHTEHAIGVVKAYLEQQGIDVRRESWADYGLFGFDPCDGRLLKRDEALLNDEIFEFIPEEII